MEIYICYGFDISQIFGGGDTCDIYIDIASKVEHEAGYMGPMSRAVLVSRACDPALASCKPVLVIEVQMLAVETTVQYSELQTLAGAACRVAGEKKIGQLHTPLLPKHCSLLSVLREVSPSHLAACDWCLQGVTNSLEEPPPS